jgi:acetoin utilization protein AcuB
MTLGDVMTKQPVVVDLDTPVRAVADLMRNKGIRHLPVVDAGAHVLGIVPDHNLRHAAFLAPHRVKAPRVRDVMTWSVVTTQADTALVRAALTMFQRRIFLW